jgi:hypothetical protein
MRLKQWSKGVKAQLFQRFIDFLLPLWMTATYLR